jgi:[ribosomal protein S5]-alanine N-acetyltransferase
MIPAPLRTRNLELVPKTRQEVEAMVEAMSPQERAQLSADWLARIRSSSTVDPWVHGFSAVHRESGSVVGSAGFRGPPADGAVEIAYGVAADDQGKGYATEMAQALVNYAFSFPAIELVRAHTLPNAHPSKRVLAKCGFVYVSDVIDPEDGRVSRFEIRRSGYRSPSSTRSRSFTT